MTVAENYVDRIEASKILNCSTRTVDRYMRKYRLKTRKDGRRVLIKKIDVDRIIQDQVGHFLGENASASQVRDSVSNLVVSDVKVEKKNPNTEKINAEQQVYKELYAETKKELSAKQERLEAATYRVGQLESQVKNMVPMLDYNKKERELEEAQKNMEVREVETNKKIAKVQNELRSERVAKWVYLSLVSVLLVVQPILFFLWAFA